MPTIGYEHPWCLRGDTIAAQVTDPKSQFFAGAAKAGSTQYSVAAAGGPVYAPAGSAPMSSMSYGQGGVYSAAVGGAQYATSAGQYSAQGK
jgi:hypothetical protein